MRGLNLETINREATLCVCGEAEDVAFIVKQEGADKVMEIIRDVVSKD